MNCKHGNVRNYVFLLSPWSREHYQKYTPVGVTWPSVHCLWIDMEGKRQSPPSLPSKCEWLQVHCYSYNSVCIHKHSLLVLWGGKEGQSPVRHASWGNSAHYIKLWSNVLSALSCNATAKIWLTPNLTQWLYQKTKILCRLIPALDACLPIWSLVFQEVFFHWSENCTEKMRCRVQSSV